MATDLILGTAGHIDHGKTALVRALTGTDTDRLPEEKRRGITIELGFARLLVGDFRLGIVDVPGHERFVRQMLAGATGMHLAMLIVAADDSVKPQTREHLDVLRLLDLPTGVIVITKCDLVDEDWLTLVEEEIRELVTGTFFEPAPIIHTSATTGQGIEQLKQALESAAMVAAEKLTDQDGSAPFRMAVDRTFSIEGHGTVVTGSVANGNAEVGAELTLEPLGKTVRVRGLHNHDETVQQVHRGQRAAINIAGVHHDEILRGAELASAGHLAASELLTIEVEVLPHATRPIRNRSRLRLHLGTAEILATIRTLDGRAELLPGDSAFAQLFLRDAAVAIWNQPLVLRAESPVETVGGGRVLQPHPRPLRRPTAQQIDALKQLRDSDDAVRAAAAILLSELACWKPEDLPRLAGVADPATTIHQLMNDGIVVELSVSPKRNHLLHQEVLQNWQHRLVATLEGLHEQFPLKAEIERSHVLRRFAYLADDPLITALLKSLESQGTLRIGKAGLALTAHRTQLSPAQQEIQDRLLEQYREAKFQPPTVAELTAKQEPGKAKEITNLIQLAVANGDLVHISQDLHLHRDAAHQLREKLTPKLQAGGMTLSSIRELLGTTRKFAVPICEYLDRIGFTRRDGDERVLA